MNRYDLICSLGGNCSVAHNLLYRRLRKFALYLFGLKFNFTLGKERN